MIYAIIADGIHDQTVESHEEMTVETYELRQMGHRVKIIKFDNWAQHAAWEDSRNF